MHAQLQKESKLIQHICDGKSSVQSSWRIEEAKTKQSGTEIKIKNIKQLLGFRLNLEGMCKFRYKDYELKNRQQSMNFFLAATYKLKRRDRLSAARF